MRRTESPLEFLDLGGPPTARTCLLLHGLGADEHDLAPLGRDLVPRCRVQSLKAPFPYVVGTAWYDLPGAAGGVTGIGPEPETFRNGIRLIDAHLTWLRDHGHPPPYLLVGFSQGALMSLSFATLRPEKILGIVALSGYLPAEALLPGPVSSLRALRIFLAHGRSDDLLPVALGRDAHARCRAAGAKVVYQEHAQGHTIPRETWAAALDFISSL